MKIPGSKLPGIELGDWAAWSAPKTLLGTAQLVCAWQVNGTAFRAGLHYPATSLVIKLPSVYKIFLVRCHLHTRALGWQRAFTPVAFFAMRKTIISVVVFVFHLYLSAPNKALILIAMHSCTTKR